MPFVLAPDGVLEHQPMPGAELKALRRRLNMRKLEFGQLLGLTGEARNICATVARYENNRRDISPMMERLALMLLWFHQDHGRLPDLDRGMRGLANEHAG